MLSNKLQNVGPAFVLASIVTTYPDAAYVENIKLLLDDDSLSNGLDENSVNKLTQLRAQLADLIGNPEQLADLCSEYIDRFDRGRDLNSLYETEYGRSRAMVKGNELADIAGFYRAFGFETGGDGVKAEMHDHVAVELEFYALLAFKTFALNNAGNAEGVEIVLDARRKFLRDHLARYLGALCERPGVKESIFFSTAFGFCYDLVMSECRSLDVNLEPVQWLSGQSEGVEMSCGGSASCEVK
jgi:nitrate reductase assembly molybdenum cofactor insertion protein NarJ